MINVKEDVSFKIKNKFFEVIGLFAGHAYEKGLPIFIIDPDFLLNFNETLLLMNSNCSYFCKENRTNFQFGIMAQFFQFDINLLKSFEKSFKVTEFKFSSELADIIFLLDSRRDLITSHLHFQHILHNYTIILYIFHPIPFDMYYFLKDFETSILGLYQGLENVKILIDDIRLRVPPYPEEFLEQIQESEFIPCDLKRAAFFQRRFEKNISEDEVNKKKEFRYYARELLIKTIDSLKEVDVPFWISSGTCLGWFRQCDFIDYSRDVDIGIFIKDYDPNLISILYANGLYLMHSFGKVNDSYELSFANEQLKLDIFFFYEESHYMWNGGTDIKNGQKFKYIFPKFHLCWSSLQDLIVRVPCESELYIKANYGEDWFNPITHWDWRSSPSNVKPNGYWPKNERNLVMQSFF